MNTDPEFDGLNFAIEKSLQYHQRRRAWFERWHKFGMFLVIVLGSAAFGDVARTWPALSWATPATLGLVIAVIAAGDLVFGFSRKARDHEVLHREFTRVAIDLRAATARSEEVTRSIQARRLEIETEEPPIYWALEASCHNEVTLAWGRQHHGLVELEWYHRFFMHVFRFEKSQLRLSTPKQVPMAAHLAAG
jgi:hypothetical protein